MIRFDRHSLSILALSATVSLLIGCGQKGPLYLPDSGVDSLAESDFDQVEQASQVLGPTLDRSIQDSGSLIPSR